MPLQPPPQNMRHTLVCSREENLLPCNRNMTTAVQPVTHRYMELAIPVRQIVLVQVSVRH
jgi:hypothetical protein